jgi:hypothetical protein
MKLARPEIERLFSLFICFNFSLVHLFLGETSFYSLFSEEHLEPIGRVLEVSFQIVLKIHKSEAITIGVTGIPFKVIKKCPCIVCLHIYAPPAKI